MKVAITGASSFTGYHLAAGFLDCGFDVTALAGPHQRTGIVAERIELLTKRGITFVPVDVREPATITQSIAQTRPDVFVQHEGYTTDYTSPDFDLHTAFGLNVLPLKPIFEGMAAIGGAIICTGTVSEYSDGDEPHVESEPCVPSMPYGLSKLTATLYAEQLARRLGVPTRVARIFLPFGPLDNPGKMLPSVIASLRAGQHVALSAGHQRRDFIHTDDVFSAYRCLLDDAPRSPFEIYNVCTGESPELRDVVLEFAAALGADPALCDFGALPMRPGEAPVIAGSSEKLRALGWTPMGWREAVRKLAATPA